MVAYEDVPRSRLLSPAEVAVHLGVQTSTLAAWRRRGVGPAPIHLTTRCVRYTESEVELFLALRLRRAGTTDR